MSYSSTPWETLRQLLKEENRAEVAKFIDALSSPETARAISRLSEEEQQTLFSILSPEDAADVIEDISEIQAAGIVENLSSEQAVAIMEELHSDHLVDVLGEMDSDASESILERWSQGTPEDAGHFSSMRPTSAGGLMISEFLAYRVDNTIQDVLDDLQAKRKEYVTTMFSTSLCGAEENWRGTARARPAVPRRDTMLDQVMIRSPLSVSDKASLGELENSLESTVVRGTGGERKQQIGRSGLPRSGRRGDQ